LLLACNSSSQSTGTAHTINGNWYATAPAYTPSPANPISGVGFALAENNGSLKGNVTTYLVSAQLPCVSLAFDLPASGTIDEANHLSVTATDGIVLFTFDGTLGTAGDSFSDGSYTVSGQEAYPTTVGFGANPIERVSTATSSCSATLNGQLLASLGNYQGTLTAGNGTQVDASISLQQSATPYAGSSTFGPSIITQGREYIYPSGFAVNGSITLKNSACGVTSASIQPKEGFLFGNYLVVEFDTNTTYKTGTALAFSIDPTSGGLTLVPGDFIQEYNGSCYMPYVAGNLIRQTT
jgi:hypothetical protein